MADGRKDEQCAHDNCNCAAGSDGDYCSAYCEGASGSGTTGIACECGHADCAGELTP